MRNLSSAAPADPPTTGTSSAEKLTLRMHSLDEDQPIEERLDAPEAERRFAEIRDQRDSWPTLYGAELVGDDDDTLDSW